MIAERLKPICLIGVASDLGAERRGSNDLSALLARAAGSAAGAGAEPILLSSLARATDESALGPPYYVDAINELAESVFDAVLAALRRGQLPIVIGGDHSVSIGAVRAARHLSEVGVLWLDSHPDLNTIASSPSGRVHGMALSAIIGIEKSLSGRPHRFSSVDPRNVHVFGVQSIDALEDNNLRLSGVGITLLSEIRARGWRACISPILSRFAAAGHPIYLSIDLDVLDPREYPGVNAPCESGLRGPELLDLITAIASEVPVIGVDVVEYNPAMDIGAQTADFVVTLLESLSGVC